MRARRELSLAGIEKVAFGQKPSTWTEAQRAEVFRTLPGLKDNKAVLDALEVAVLHAFEAAVLDILSSGVRAVMPGA